MGLYERVAQLEKVAERKVYVLYGADVMCILEDKELIENAIRKTDNLCI